jgi:hypothetical protein
MGPSAAAARLQAQVAMGKDTAEAGAALGRLGVAAPGKFARVLVPAR